MHGPMHVKKPTIVLCVLCTSTKYILVHKNSRCIACEWYI